MFSQGLTRPDPTFLPPDPPTVVVVTRPRLEPIQAEGTHEASGKGSIKFTFDNMGPMVLTSRNVRYYVGFVPS